MARSPLGLLLAVLVLGCSSASFDVASTGDAGDDTGTASGDVAVDSGEPGDTGSGGDDAVTPDDTGASSDTGNVLDGGSVDASGPCAVPGEVVEVWVDATSMIDKPTGTSTCPFRRIVDAVAYINTLPARLRTIRVRAGTYTEPSAVILRSQVTLSGAGIGKTIIAGGGACTVGTCIVRVEGGAILDGVSVDAGPTAKHGVITGSAATGTIVLKNLKVYGAVGDGNAGILTTGAAVIGPNVESTGNRYGLVLWGGQGVKITYSNNRFDKNMLAGINHEGSGPLTFDGGGSVSGNGAEGIRAGEPSVTAAPTHLFSNVVIKDNAGPGIRLMANASAKLRNNIITGNKFGVLVNYGTSNTVDLGSSAEAGGNTFGNATTTNKLAGICAAVTRAMPLPAVGNKWPTCPPSLKQLTDIAPLAGCEDVTSYGDVWYRGLSAPDAAGCTPG